MSFSFSKYFTEVIVHWMPWWGTQGHVALSYELVDGASVAYNSSSTVICDDQCVHMTALGITGVNADYYGPDSASAGAVLEMLSACERAGLKFSVCIDQGAIAPGLTGAQAIAEYIRVLDFVIESMAKSPAYLRDSGRAVINFFGEPAGVDWNSVRTGITKDKLALVFEGSGGFTHMQSDGAFGWVNPTTPASNINLPSITAFTAAAAANSSKLAFYPLYPGFDDSMATWGTNRFMSRRIGQTLMDTIAHVPSNPKYVLLATWNDYEEGTNMETSGSRLV